MQCPHGLDTGPCFLKVLLVGIQKKLPNYPCYVSLQGAAIPSGLACSTGNRRQGGVSTVETETAQSHARAVRLRCFSGHACWGTAGCGTPGLVKEACMCTVSPRGPSSLVGAASAWHRIAIWARLPCAALYQNHSGSSSFTHIHSSGHLAELIKFRHIGGYRHLKKHCLHKQ